MLYNFITHKQTKIANQTTKDEKTVPRSLGWGDVARWAGGYRDAGRCDPLVSKTPEPDNYSRHPSVGLHNHKTVAQLWWAEHECDGSLKLTLTQKLKRPVDPNDYEVVAP
jgi:hypothetical protein